MENVLGAVLVAVGMALLVWRLAGRATAGASVSGEARRMVATGARLVDVRTSEEFAAGHLPGAVNLPLAELPRRLGELGGPATPLVVYCRSGQRSGKAQGLLHAQGYRQVLDLGPMTAW